MPAPLVSNSAMAAFRGFPPQALEFLTELEANNDRDWFKANRARYDEYVVAPATALGEDLSDLGRAADGGHRHEKGLLGRAAR